MQYVALIFFYWKCFLVLIAFIALFDAIILLLNKSKRKKYYILFKNKSVSFIEWSNINIVDCALLCLNTIRSNYMGVLRLPFSILLVIISYIFFVFFIFINASITILTVLLNIDNSIKISSDFTETNDSVFDDKYLTIWEVFYLMLSNIWKLSKFFSYILIYKLLKKERPSPSILLAHRVAVSLLFGFPWYIIIVACEFHNAPFIDLKNKDRRIRYLLYIKYFFKNYTCYLGSKTLLIYPYTDLNIQVKNFRIKVNPLTQQQLDLLNTLASARVPTRYLNATGVWELSQAPSGINFYKTVMRHQIFYNTDSFNNPNNGFFFALVLTHAKKIKGIDYPTTELYKYNLKKPEDITNTQWMNAKTQHCTISGIPTKDKQSVRENMYLKSFWDNQGLSNSRNFVGLHMRIKIMYCIMQTNAFPLQGDSFNSALLKFDHGSVDPQTIDQFAYKTILHHNNIKPHKPMTPKQLMTVLGSYSSFKSWYRASHINETNKQQILHELSRISNEELYDQLHNIATSTHNNNILLALNDIQNKHNSLLKGQPSNYIIQ